MTRCPRCQRRLPPSGDCPIHGRPTGVVAAAGDRPPPVRRAAARLADRAPPRDRRHRARVRASRATTARRAILKWGRWRERDIHVRFELEADGAARGRPGVDARAHRPRRDRRLAVHHHGAARRRDARGLDGARRRARRARRDPRRCSTSSRPGWPRSTPPASSTAISSRRTCVIGPRGVRLIDFGLAKQPVGLGLTQIGAVVGTVHYLAPEQIRGDDRRSPRRSLLVRRGRVRDAVRPAAVRRRAPRDRVPALGVPAAVGARVARRARRARRSWSPRASPSSRRHGRRPRPSVRAWIARAVAGASTARGVAPRALGVRGRVALLWIVGLRSARGGRARSARSTGWSSGGAATACSPRSPGSITTRRSPPR